MNIDTRLFPTRWTPWQSFQPTVCCSDLHWKASWRQLKVPRLSTMASKWPWIALNEFGDIRLRRWDPFLLFEVKPPSQGLRNCQLEGKVRTETILPARARHFRPIQRHQPLFVGLPSWHVDYKRRVFLSGSLSQRRGTSPETLVSCIIVTVRSKESKWLNTGRGKLDLVSQGWVEPLPTCVDPTLKPELKMIPTASSPRCESGIRSFPTSLVTQWLCWNKSRNAQLWTTGDWAPLSTLLGL